MGYYAAVGLLEGDHLGSPMPAGKPILRVESEWSGKAGSKSESGHPYGGTECLN